jgi:hypothetical protein
VVNYLQISIKKQQQKACKLHCCGVGSSVVDCCVTKFFSSQVLEIYLNVVDPKLFVTDPDSTFQKISDPTFKKFRIRFRIRTKILVLFLHNYRMIVKDFGTFQRQLYLNLIGI